MRRVFLDTCVLYPPLLRGVLLDLALAGLFVPLWSPSVAAEWVHVTARRGETGTPAHLAQMAALWPRSLTPPGDPALLDPPDPADRHVLAGAIAGGADLVLTLNRRDFPRRALAPHGLSAQSPDDFVMDLWLATPAEVEAAVARAWPALEGRSLRNALKRAGLPRLGRALEPP